MESITGMQAQAALLKTEFPGSSLGLYFNHAAMAPWPRRTAEAVQAFAAENAAHGPAAYREWIAREKRLRESLARLIGASSAADIALLKNTTEAISVVASGIDWREGDNVVLPRGEFPSNRMPWLAQAEHGVELREIDIRAAGHAESALIDALDENSRVLAVSSVQFSDGFRLDLAPLGDACKSRGVLFCVDAIQHLGALRMDVEACHVSFLAADAHKWLLGPEGIAVFYSTAEARQKLTLRQWGWHMSENPWAFEGDFTQTALSAKRFEAGSPNNLGQVALQASLELLHEVGAVRLEQRVLENTEWLMSRLRALPGVQLVSRPETGRRSGIVSFRSDRLSPALIHQGLARRGVTCAVRDRAVRLSPHCYQGLAEMEAVCGLIGEVLVSKGK